MKQKILNVLRVLLVALFLSYYGGTTLFYHTHYFSWGIVTHSHPYFPFDHEKPMHSHSEAQCQTIAQLSFFLLVLGTVAFVFFNVCAHHFYYTAIRRISPDSYSPSDPLRAPPALVCSFR